MRHCLLLGSVVAKARLGLDKDLSHRPSLYHPKEKACPFHFSIFTCEARRCAASRALDWEICEEPEITCRVRSGLHRFAFFLSMKRGIHSCHQFFKGTVTLSDCSAPRLPSLSVLSSFLSGPDKQLRRRQSLTGRVLGVGEGKQASSQRDSARLPPAVRQPCHLPVCPQ